MIPFSLKGDSLFKELLGALPITSVLLVMMTLVVPLITLPNLALLRSYDAMADESPPSAVTTENQSSERVKEEQNLTADQVQISTPIYRPNFDGFNPRSGVYRYQVAWQGIPAAEATLRVERLGKFFKLIAGARTYSPISLLYDLKYRAEGLLSAINLSPVRTFIRQKENSKEKNTEISFSDNGQIEAVRWQNNGEPPKKLAFQPNNFTIDPFAAAFLARSLDWKMGEKREFDTFNGKSRYLITLAATGESQLDFNGENKDVWEITPSVKNLTNSKANSKLRSATIYVTKDSLREVLLLRSKVFIGSVTTRLEEFAEDNGEATMAMASDLSDMRAALK